MNAQELDQRYNEKKVKFHRYINNVKKNSKWDIYTIINATLVKNPYASEFPKNYFSNIIKKQSKLILFIKIVLKYYLKIFYLFFSYIIAFILYKIYYKKQRKDDITTIIDTFGLVDKTNKERKFKENYLVGIYEIFEKYDTKYTILLRPYGVGKNPFKLKSFFTVINEDEKDFIFEYELLNIFDFFKIFYMIVVYPFKTLRLLQKESTELDKLFNNSLINDIGSFSFESITRYILGTNLSKINSLKKVFSWSEFQVIERSFNYAIRINSDIKLVALQFYLNYEIYFNAYVDDIDYEMQSSPHKVLVNGTYYLQKIKNVKYDVGVSLRYGEIFTFKGIKSETNVLLLGSYIEIDTKYMLENVKTFDNIIFKNHPAVDIKKFGILNKNITVSNENIYQIFENTQLVIGTASGTSVEAVACGISVIIIASQNNLTANPLVQYGKGQIWDIAFNSEDVERLYRQLIEYRKNNVKKIQEISSWYKNNFFQPLNSENLIKTFEFRC